MTSIRTLLPFGAAAAVLLAAGPADAQERVLATDVRPTEVAAWTDTVVWSAFDPRENAFRLVRSVDGGPAQPLPVAPSPRPFDVDLGTSRTGALTAVYTRCDDGERGCDVYRLVLASGREERLAALSSPRWDERDPSIFRGRVAFVRHERVGGRLQDTIRLGDTTRGSRGTRALVKGGSLEQPELGVSHLAYVRALRREDQVHVVRISSARDRLVYRARSGGLNVANVTGPTLSDTARSFVWARTNIGSQTGNRIVRYGIASRMLAYAQGSSRWASTAWAGGDLGLATASAIEGTCFPGSDESPEASVCRVAVTGPVRFGPRP